MTKVEKEIPVVSPELAETFKKNKNSNDFFPSEVCCEDSNYESTPEYSDLSTEDFEKLLIYIYTLGYEIKKPKLYYITLSSKTKLEGYMRYLNWDLVGNCYVLSTSMQTEMYKTQFTQKEVDEFLKDEPKDMWIIEEADDDE